MAEKHKFDYQIALISQNKIEHDRDEILKKEFCKAMPLHLTIVDTTRCNLNCIMCFRNKGFLEATLRPLKLHSRHKDETIMDFNLFKRIAKEVFPYLTRITLSVAGEPFINPNFSRQLDLIQKNKVRLNIFTNATLLPKGDTLKIFVNNLHQMVVSIDAASKKTYEAIRRGAKFQRVIDNIKRFNLERDKPSKTLRPRLIFWFVLMRKNIQELPEYVRLAHRLKADAIGFTHMTVLHKKLEKESLVYHKQLANRYLKEAKKIIDDLGLEICDFPPLFKETKASESKNDNSGNGLSCRFVRREALIEVNGDVYPCCAPEKTGLLMGNLKKQTFKEIWNSKRYQLLRASFRDSNLYPSCQNCYQRLKEHTSENSNIYFP